ncbi:MAG: DNA polymerase III subunit gamma/tau [Lachnospiraceae bacterium]
MSYMALYRKFRPQQFDEVKGQEHIVTTLCNQVKANRVGHAYLFCGTRGTGKTTVAKLLAKAVNCEHPIDGSPCNECPSCRQIQEQTSMNVIEIDAASNNGVDNIREIKEQIQYSPTEGKYKVYIIDEVHMLSIGAFNALLKTLEEPPSYVIFILATTEPQKIPITILSRCQRYDFHRISSDTIYRRLDELMKAEGVAAEEKALRYVAKMGDGSMRDALSLLDQCVAFYLGEELTYDRVLEVLGAVDTTVFEQLLQLCREQNVVGVMQLVEHIILEGKELQQFITDYIWFLRNLLLLQTSDGIEDVLDISTERMEAEKEIAQNVPAEILMRYINELSETVNRLRQATNKRVLVELALIRLCKPQMSSQDNTVMERLAALEQQIEEQKNRILTAPSAYAAPSDTQPITEEPILHPMEEIEKRLPPAEVEDLKKLVAHLQAWIPKQGGPVANFLGKAKVTLSDTGSSIRLLFQNNNDGIMAKDYFERDGHKNLNHLAQELSGQIGKEVEITCLLCEQPKNTIEQYDLLKLNINMPVEIVD